MQLFAVVNLWHVLTEYLAVIFRALFVKHEMTALATMVAVSSCVIRHDLQLFLFVVMPENARMLRFAYRACGLVSTTAPNLLHQIALT